MAKLLRTVGDHGILAADRSIVRGDYRVTRDPTPSTPLIPA